MRLHEALEICDTAKEGTMFIRRKLGPWCPVPGLVYTKQGVMAKDWEVHYEDKIIDDFALWVVPIVYAPALLTRPQDCATQEEWDRAVDRTLAVSVANCVVGSKWATRGGFMATVVERPDPDADGLTASSDEIFGTVDDPNRAEEKKDLFDFELGIRQDGTAARHSLGPSEDYTPSCSHRFVDTGFGKRYCAHEGCKAEQVWSVAGGWEKARS